MRTSTCCAYGDRKTSTVCHCHEFRTFAPLGLSHLSPPFLAPTKVPSIKPSLTSIPPRSYRSCAKPCRSCSITPNRTHRWKRRWQVVWGGYRSGKSCHCAPVRRIHKTPFNTERASCHGRPRFGFPSRSASGMYGSISSHCSSVTSIPPPLLPLFPNFIPFSIYEISCSHLGE